MSSGREMQGGLSRRRRNVRRERTVRAGFAVWVEERQAVERLEAETPGGEEKMCSPV